MTLDTFDLKVIKQIFRQVCKDYLNHLTREGTTIKGKVSNFLSSSFGYSDANINRNRTKELLKRIENVRNADDLVSLVLSLGKEANEVKSLTARSHSTYSEICHLIAQWIIRLPEIAKYEYDLNPKIEISSVIHELPEKLNAKMQEIHKKIDDKKIENTKRVRDGEKVTMEISHAHMRDLYCLGDYHLDHDPEYIKRIFPDSHYRWNRPDNFTGKINPNYPIVMQKNFAEIQIKRFRPDLEDKILHEYLCFAMAAKPENTDSDVDIKKFDAKTSDALIDAKSSDVKDAKSNDAKSATPQTPVNASLNPIAAVPAVLQLSPAAAMPEAAVITSPKSKESNSSTSIMANALDIKAVDYKEPAAVKKGKNKQKHHKPKPVQIQSNLQVDESSRSPSLTS